MFLKCLDFTPLSLCGATLLTERGSSVARKPSEPKLEIIVLDKHLTLYTYPVLSPYVFVSSVAQHLSAITFNLPYK